MIEIKLLDGEIIQTSQYTTAQAEQAVAAGQIELGGIPDDFAVDDHVQVPRRVVYAAAVASIAEVPA
ncbi:hypothetical protein ACQP2Y_21270 [Actinoplanes sp. CA-051413]|uniref:hypothetical protein n=1 Tax=Actinoplanes sp. CA-051413 TaxID=3239899 RepID=UPI003D9711E2